MSSLYLYLFIWIVKMAEILSGIKIKSVSNESGMPIIAVPLQMQPPYLWQTISSHWRLFVNLLPNCCPFEMYTRKITLKLWYKHSEHLNVLWMIQFLALWAGLHSPCARRIIWESLFRYCSLFLYIGNRNEMWYYRKNSNISRNYLGDKIVDN